jgi:hypothetical protein
MVNAKQSTETTNLGEKLFVSVTTSGRFVAPCLTRGDEAAAI